jgi:hypothetical protein
VVGSGAGTSMRNARQTCLNYFHEYGGPMG